MVCINFFRLLTPRVFKKPQYFKELAWPLALASIRFIQTETIAMASFISQLKVRHKKEPHGCRIVH